MYLIAYAIWIAAAAVIAWQVARRIPVRALWREVIGWGLAVVLVLSPHWDVILGAPTLSRICTAEAGLVRRAPIRFPLSSVSISRDAAGVCYECFVLLLMGATNETQVNFSYPPNARALTNGIGPVRYRLAPSSDPACATFNAVYATGYPRKDLWSAADAQDDGKICIVAERIAEITAAYELSGPLRSKERHGVVVLEAHRVELRRRDADSPLAALTSFTQLPWNGRIVSMQAALPPKRACPSFETPSASNFGVVTLVKKLMAGED